jgi:predicted nucleic acid-binding protein
MRTLMRSYGVRMIVTHDRDFRRFDGIRVPGPLRVSACGQ